MIIHSLLHQSFQLVTIFLSDPAAMIPGRGNDTAFDSQRLLSLPGTRHCARYLHLLPSRLCPKDLGYLTITTALGDRYCFSSEETVAQKDHILY